MQFDPFFIVFLLHMKWRSFFDWLCRRQPNNIIHYTKLLNNYVYDQLYQLDNLEVPKFWSLSNLFGITKKMTTTEVPFNFNYHC